LQIAEETRRRHGLMPCNCECDGRQKT